MPEISSPPEALSFETALADLQRIVADLEEGRVGLEESLARFERGIGLLKTCYQVLEKAEQRIEQLVGMKSDGTPITTPFDGSATADSDTPTAGRRRTKKSKPEPESPPKPIESKPVEPENADNDDSGFLF
jgi:exodeoxyribonuclease VII small subunit